MNQFGATEPGSTRMSLFQLSESTDLARITKVIEHLANQPDLSKSKAHGHLGKVLQRYCNGDYGFDSYYSTSGRFQNAVINILDHQLGADPHAMHYYIKDGTLGCLSQIIEESIIYIHREAQLGSKAKVSNLSLFASKVLRFNELTLDQVPEAGAHIAENLKRVFQRFKRIAQKP